MSKKRTHASTTNLGTKSSDYTSTTAEAYIMLSLILEGEFPPPFEYTFFTLFNGLVVLDAKWNHQLMLEGEMMMNLQDPYDQMLIADRPLVLLVRAVGKGPGKEQDPLLHPDNRAGAMVDLFPLVLGEDKVHVTVPLVNTMTGAATGCTVEVTAMASPICTEINKVPLIITMISGHCIPVPPRDATVYVAAVGLAHLTGFSAVNFGISHSSHSATKVVWAATSAAGFAANTAYNVPNDDVFVPPDLEPHNTPKCPAVYWNSMKRVLVDPNLLRDKLDSPFLVEVAGLPKMGKTEIRGRYTGYLDAKVLLEPGQLGVSTSARLWAFSEAKLPEDGKPLLDLPPASAKTVSARDSDVIVDDFGHSAYVIVRFDLSEPLTPKLKIAALFKTMGILPPDGIIVPCNELELDPLPEDTHMDARRIRKDCGALAVHKELGALACLGAVPMGQSIKRTAANKLLMRVRMMLKTFQPEDGIPYIEWQDIVTGQHAATRRAVTASFAPQPPPLRAPHLVAASRARLAGDHRIAAHHVKMNLAAKPGQPSPLLSKALECLVQRNDSRARDYYLEALKAHPKNRYILWLYGAQDFDKGKEVRDAAWAALRIAVKGDYSDGISNAIGWAAMHAFNHFNKNDHMAFIALKKMRKSYDLSKEWKRFYETWIQTSGEEEIYWIPTIISTYDPLVVAATFFLCLRCYAFAERLICCAEEGCFTKGARRKSKPVGECRFDLYYVRAASLLLRGHYGAAFEITNQGINKYGPSAIMSQMQTSCLVCIHGWSDACRTSFFEAELAGATQCPAVLFCAAFADFRTAPESALQWAARSQQMSPSAHTALLMGLIYRRLGEYKLSERWAAAAVKLEPLLADGWGLLGILALYGRDPEKARAMIRTAHQAGPISPYIKNKIDDLSKMIKMEALPDTLVTDMCHHDKPYILGDRESFVADQ